MKKKKKLSGWVRRLSYEVNMLQYALLQYALLNSQKVNKNIAKKEARNDQLEGTKWLAKNFHVILWQILCKTMQL